MTLQLVRAVAGHSIQAQKQRAKATVVRDAADDIHRARHRSTTMRLVMVVLQTRGSS